MWLRIPASGLILAALVFGCGPVPGGALEGALAPIPADWPRALDGDRALCEIESRPADPHSIQLDCFASGDGLYVQSHRWAFADWWPTESWAEIWLEHPDVRVRLGSSLFELRAVHVTEPSERTPILEARGYDPPPEGIALFRFDARQEGFIVRNTSGLLQGLGLPPIDQIGFVVRSLAEAKERYGAIFGPFSEMDGSVEAADYRGKVADAKFGLLFGRSGELEIEFIEWQGGESPHREFIEAGREGMHHLRYRVDDADAWIEKLATVGYRPIWSKHFSPEIVFAYLEREGEPLLIELLQMPGGPGTSQD